MLPLSYAQQRLWFLHRMEGPSATYDIPRAWRLAGGLKAEALEQALNDVVRRHESLRTIFPEENGKAWQQILAEVAVTMPVEAVREEQLNERLQAQAQRGFELDREVPIRARLFRLSEAEHVLLPVLHHIAGDGWSMGRLWRDLTTAYTARLAGQELKLPDLPVRYADYTLWQRELLAQEEPVQLAYW